MGADRPSLAGAVRSTIRGTLQKNMVDRERYLRDCGLGHAVCRGAGEPGERQRIRITAATHSLAFRRKVAQADFVRVLVVASQLAAASPKTFDVFGEPGSASDDKELARQLESVPGA